MLVDETVTQVCSDGSYGGGGCGPIIDTKTYQCDIGDSGGSSPGPGGSPIGGGGPAGGGGNEVANPTLHDAVANASGNALMKLSDTACQALLKQNVDASGSTLWNHMTNVGYTDPTLYFANALTFLTGINQTWSNGTIPCNVIGTSAWVYKTGTQTIYVCSQFGGLTVGTGGAVLVHEMLHTLGLRESPADGAGFMSSQDIQAMVERACGTY